MNTEEILKLLQERHPDVAFEAVEETHEAFRLPVERLREVARTLKEDSDLAFDYLMFLTATDWIEEDRLELSYSFYSYTHKHRFALKLSVPRQGARVPTVSDLWATADWHEREAFDLFGVTFEGHPDLRRILNPWDWPGHPLLRDFKHPNLVPKPDTGHEDRPLAPGGKPATEPIVTTRHPEGLS